MRKRELCKWMGWTLILLVVIGCGERSQSPADPTNLDAGATPADDSASSPTNDVTTFPDLGPLEEDTPSPKNDTTSQDTGEVLPQTDWISGLNIAEVETMPLAAIVQFQTLIPCNTSVKLIGPDLDRILPEAARLTDPDGLEHEFLVLGMRPEQSYDLVAHAIGEEGQDTQTESWSTPSLPDDFPPITVFHSDPEKMSPGVTFFGVNTVGENGKVNPQLGLLLGLDATGTVVWYLKPGKGVQGIKSLPNGHLMFVSGGTQQTEVNALGEVVRVLTNGGVGVDSMHHTFFPLPDGHLLLLSTELQIIDGYPNGETYSVVGDLIVELDENASIVDQWSLFDVLDPYRIVHGWDTTFWSKIYPNAPGGAKDWTHCNSIIVDENDGCFVISSRHQDLVFKMDPETLQLVWVLGEDAPDTDGDDNWPFLALVGEGQYPSQQHSASILSNGHLLVYDNGTAVGFSRAVEYALDLETMTATQVWEYVDPDYEPLLFSRTAGSAVALAGGNILVADAALQNPLAESNKDTYGRVVEVTHTTPPEKVFEVALRNPDALGEKAYRSFAAIRLSDIYDLLGPTD